jgi:hypothetical protein
MDNCLPEEDVVYICRANACPSEDPSCLIHKAEGVRGFSETEGFASETDGLVSP